MTWSVFLHDDFDAEFSALDEDLQDELLAHAKLLVEFGPNLGRPTVDGLKGSKHANMKELRFNWEGGVWRVAFAFDFLRHAICLLVATRVVLTKDVFTGDCWPLPMLDSTTIYQSS